MRFADHAAWCRHLFFIGMLAEGHQHCGSAEQCLVDSRHKTTVEACRRRNARREEASNVSPI
jgi:hypothetical protein